MFWIETMLTCAEFTGIHTIILRPGFVCCACRLSVIFAVIQFINTSFTKNIKNIFKKRVELHIKSILVKTVKSNKIL